jgi:hypothetical protein
MAIEGELTVVVLIVTVFCQTDPKSLILV